MTSITLRSGDSMQVLQTLSPSSVGAVVTDPPYDLGSHGFMGKTWDTTGIAFSYEFWSAVYRVLRPGGVVKAFSGTRTQHRMTAAIAAAGFVDVGLEPWIYGSGFPKSKSVPLFIDKMLGRTGNRGRAVPTASIYLPGAGKYSVEKLTANIVPPYEPVSDEAKAWDGWGTGLKPAWEPVITARKP